MTRAGTLVCVIAFAVAACGKSSDPKPDVKAKPAGPAESGRAPGPDQPAPAKPKDEPAAEPAKAAAPLPACGYLTEAEATAILGAPAKYVGDNPMDPEVSGCEVTTSTDDKLGLTAGFEFAEADAYELGVTQIGAQDQKPEAVPDLGEKATWIGSDVMSRVLVLKNGRTMSLHLSEPYGKAGPKDTSVALAAKIAARM
jgi:hypothetical protein